MTTLPRGSKAVLDPAEFPELDLLRQNWQTIRDEGLELVRQNYFDATKRPGTAGYYDVGFRSVLQVWLEPLLHQLVRVHPSFRKRLCPRTVEILKSVPAIHGAMFAYLPRRSQLTRHADPIAVSLRYHLGLATPNSDACFINVDGRNQSWRDGEVIMFDETYLHYVRNDTDSDRLILMCDVKRPLNPLGALFNVFYQAITRASVVPNTAGRPRGLANRVFAGLAPLRRSARRLKSTNRPLYLVIKWSANSAAVLAAAAAGRGRGAAARLVHVNPCKMRGRGRNVFVAKAVPNSARHVSTQKSMQQKHSVIPDQNSRPPAP